MVYMLDTIMRLRLERYNFTCNARCIPLHIGHAYLVFFQKKPMGLQCFAVCAYTQLEITRF